jgi:hypothetical protein
MQNKEEFRNLISRIISRAATVALAIATVFALTVVLTQSAQRQTFTVLHNFTGGGDGANPAAGLTMDIGGNLYGTTSSNRSSNGSVFKLGKTGSGWILMPLHVFEVGNDGALPASRVVFGPDGSLYGTTRAGGGSDCIINNVSGCGIVFSLTPPVTACETALCQWNETVLYRFAGGSDGASPYTADLLFDQAGNIYGTTWLGGSEGSCLYGYHCGTVYELTRSGGSWNESAIWSFGGNGDEVMPVGGVIFDDAGTSTVLFREGARTALRISAMGADLAPQSFTS